MIHPVPVMRFELTASRRGFLHCPPYLHDLPNAATILVSPHELSDGILVGYRK